MPNITNTDSNDNTLKQPHDTDIGKNSLEHNIESSTILHWEDSKFFIFYGIMSCIGIYHRFIQDTGTMQYIIADAGDWTIFILTVLSNLVRANSWYIGVFGIVLTLVRRNLIKFHSYYTMFSEVVFITVILSYALFLLN